MCSILVHPTKRSVFIGKWCWLSTMTQGTGLFRLMRWIGLLWFAMWTYFSLPEYYRVARQPLDWVSRFILVRPLMEGACFSDSINSCNISRASYTLNKVEIFFKWASTLYLIGYVMDVGCFFASPCGLCIGLRTGMVSCGCAFPYLVCTGHAPFWQAPKLLASL